MAPHRLLHANDERMHIKRKKAIMPVSAWARYAKLDHNLQDLGQQLTKNGLLYGLSWRAMPLLFPLFVMYPVWNTSNLLQNNRLCFWTLLTTCADDRLEWRASKQLQYCPHCLANRENMFVLGWKQVGDAVLHGAVFSLEDMCLSYLITVYKPRETFSLKYMSIQGNAGMTSYWS